MRAGVIVLVCVSFPLALAQNSTTSTLAPVINEENTTEPVDPLVGIQLQPFLQLAHGLRSGPIHILDEKTFFIQELYYDGKGPDAHFWVGIGAEPNSEGTLVSDEKGSQNTLSAYTGQNVTIRLPDPLTVHDIDYLAVWCIQFSHNFGHTFIPRRVTKASQIQKALGVQLQPFSQLAHGLRSGPIVVVNERTFFIPNLHYDGKGPDAHFWVGTGSAPSPSGVLIPDENGSTRSLSAYAGQSIYITLPKGVTVDTIDYLAVWCIEFKHNFGHVAIPNGIEFSKANGNPRLTLDNKKVVPVQKCCPMNQVLMPNGCTGKDQPFELMLDFHLHNSTHVDDEPLPAQTIQFEPFVNSITCKHEQYPLFPGEDRFSLLENGSLVVLNTQQMLSLDDYCLETVYFGDEESGDVWLTTAMVCFSSADVPVSGTIFIIYAVGVLISAVFLIITALVFMLVKEVRDTRGKCVMFYSLSMAAGFICLASAQLSGIDDERCVTIGFIIQFFLVSSFTWLTLVSWETYYKIKHHDSNCYARDKKRLYMYIGLGLFIPVITSVFSAFADQMPGIPDTVLKPQFGKNSCWFDQKEGTMLYFYIPVGFAIFCNIVLAGLMKWNLVWFQRHRSTDISWLAFKQELKPMFRSCTFLLTVMTLCWAMEIISYAVKSEGGFWTAIDIINSLQGLIVFVIFVMHRPVKDKLCKLREKKIAYSTATLEDRPMVFLNMNGNSNVNHNNHNDFLTKLRPAESVEDLT